MKRLSAFLALLLGFLVAGVPALAAFVFRVGDTVYVDGKQYSWEEWKKIRDDPSLRPSQQPAATPSAAPHSPAQGAVPSGRPRVAACTTDIYYDEFPSDDEHFQCSAGLGKLTRGQIAEAGWRVDFVEKIPPLPGLPAQSTRGLPLHVYKLVISR